MLPQLRDCQAYANALGVPLEIFSNAPRPTRGNLAEALALGRSFSLRFPSTVPAQGDRSWLVVSIDEAPFWKIGGKLLLGNAVTLQLRAGKGSGWKKRAGAVSGLFEDLCLALVPAWGAVYSREEYQQQVMSFPPGARALGRDFGRILPGLFTANFFGAPYTALMGEARLLSAPARVARVGEGVLLAVDDDDVSVTDEIKAAVRQHLGPEFFFDRNAPDKRYAAPEWGPHAE